MNFFIVTSPDLIYVSKQLQSIKIDIDLIKNHLLKSKPFNYDFPIKTKEDLNALEEKIKSDPAFSLALVRINFILNI